MNQFANSPFDPQVFVDCIHDAAVVLDEKIRFVCRNAAAQHLLQKHPNLEEEINTYLSGKKLDFEFGLSKYDIKLGHGVLQMHVSVLQGQQAYLLQLRVVVEKRSRMVAPADRKRLDKFLKYSPVVLYTCEASGAYAATYISENVKEFFGYDAQTFLSDPSFWANGIHPDDRERIFTGLSNLFVHGVHRHEYRWKIADGSYRWVQDELRVVYGNNGKPMELIGYWADVEERKHWEKELLLARHQAEKASNAKSDFLSRMSHELRTPLNAVIGFGELLGLSRLDEKQKSYLQEINGAGRHLLELINEILDLSRIESGKVSLSICDVSLKPLVEECLGLMAASANARAINLQSQSMLERDPVVMADNTRLKQVLINFLSNAIKYNRDEGAVMVSLMPGVEKDIRVAVSDTGYGLGNEQLGKLFQPFERMNADDSGIEGAGIGLVISKHLIELMGGFVGVDSELGKGTTFWFELDLIDLTADDEGSESHTKPVSSKKSSSKNNLATAVGEGVKLVLYIEDNPSCIHLMEKVFEPAENIKLVSASDPQHGIHLAMQLKPDLILLDINLPLMDGYQVSAILKAAARTSCIPIVAVSASQLDYLKGETLFDNFISKPINMTGIYRCVSKHLN